MCVVENLLPFFWCLVDCRVVGTRVHGVEDANLTGLRKCNVRRELSWRFLPVAVPFWPSKLRQTEVYKSQL